MKKSSLKILSFVLSFIIVVILAASSIKNLEGFLPQYMNHPSKCFDCEQDIIKRYGEDAAWLANPTKGFDDEKEAIVQVGGNISGGFLAKTIKYY